MAIDAGAGTTSKAQSSVPFTMGLLAAVLVIAVVFISQSTWSPPMYAAFKTVHVMAAVVWIGGAVLLAVLGLVAESKGDPAELAVIARQASLVGERLFAPAGGTVLLMGIAMVIKSGLGFGHFWVILGLVGNGITFILGAFVLTPISKAISKSIAEKGPAHPDTAALIRKVLIIARLDVCMLLIVVANMVTKPFG